MAKQKINGTQIDQGYAFLAYKASTQTISSATFTKLTFETEKYDVNDVYNNANGRFTAPFDGIYQISAKAETVNPTNSILEVYVNGSTTSFRGLWTQGVRGSILSIPLKLNAGDYVEIYAYFTGDMGVRPGEQYTWFGGALIARV